MATDIPERKKEKKEKKEKKDKKEKSAKTSDDGVSKSKSEKKERRKSKDARDVAIEEEIEASGGALAPITSALKTLEFNDEELEKAVSSLLNTPDDALVPFAVPMADHDQTLQLLKMVRKSVINKSLHRGVKETCKALRKTPALSTSNTFPESSPGLVLLSADISPFDVISHIPVTCEERGIPYMYIKSRIALGMAANTKRSTSCVMISPNHVVRDKTGAGVPADYTKAFQAASKLMRAENLALAN